MNPDELRRLVQLIVKQARELKDAHTLERNAPVNYACVFSQSDVEYSELLAIASQLGKIIQNTTMGPIFQITPLDTVAGKLQLLKIRKPDKMRPELGDADFTLSNYSEFKKTSLNLPGFRLIQRENYEMIELIDSKFNAIAYFSHPTLDKQLGLA